MRVSKNKILSFILLVLMLVIVGCSSETSKKTKENNNNEEGELRIALSVQPPSLDQPATSVAVARDLSRLIFETLVTVDSTYQVVPSLAESFSVSEEDSKRYIFHLRKGVKFHNGKEMTAEDAVASMNRWVEKSSATKGIFDGATFEAEDDYTVVLQLAKPSALTLDTMASTNMAAAIMPKEVIEAAGDKGVSEYIGTGPYKFAEWKQDQYIHFTKYDEYQSLDGKPDGLSGKKEALIKDIHFEIVKDATSRLVGLQTGAYDFAYTIQYDNYDQLKTDSNLYPVFDPYGQLLIYYNEKNGPASDVKMRQAINTALNIDEVMFPTFTDRDLYTLNSGYMSMNMKKWDSNAGSEFYNQNNPEKAKKILAEIDYDKEELKIMTTRDYPHFYNAAVIVQEQLSQLGMNVKLEVYDWPTIMDKQSTSGDWDLLVAGSAYVSTPPQLLYISSTFAGGINDSTTAEMLKSIVTSNSEEEATQLWDELQGYVWEEHVPVTILASYNTLYGASNNVEGVGIFAGPLFWNTKLVR
ncbi:ABC transporter substrate-binding protein [Cytobacillus depressus]|uniref:ABC transporter substrate-binding protein n=1 Tax=Cytobacillus depressus TaxID=1602942 RepID=A0A6L3V6E5_9BACI|nr:ABC transporter substrate-binding protein [Cytobacillus depressus]KAB2336708.1 ABC transporter substrate-binding protein [Cytobacillus depressus]